MSALRSGACLSVEPDIVEVVLTKSDTQGQDFGFASTIEVKHEGYGVLRIASICPDGLLAAWNANCPASAICPGSRILSVNGVRDNVVLMRELLRAERNEFAQMEIERCCSSLAGANSDLRDGAGTICESNGRSKKVPGAISSPGCKIVAILVLCSVLVTLMLAMASGQGTRLRGFAESKQAPTMSPTKTPSTPAPTPTTAPTLSPPNVPQNASPTLSPTETPSEPHAALPSSRSSLTPSPRVPTSLPTEIPSRATYPTVSPTAVASQPTRSPTAVTSPLLSSPTPAPRVATLFPTAAPSSVQFRTKSLSTWVPLRGGWYNVAEDEGRQIGVLQSWKVRDCKLACDQDDACRSFSYCGNACYLKDKAITKDSPSHYNKHCTTYYTQDQDPRNGDAQCFHVFSDLAVNTLLQSYPSNPDSQATGYADCRLCTNGTMTCDAMVFSGHTRLIASHIHYAGDGDGDMGEGPPVINFCGDNAVGFLNDGTEYSSPCSDYNDGVADMVNMPAAIVKSSSEVATLVARLQDIAKNPEKYYFNFHSVASWAYWKRQGKHAGMARGRLAVI